MYEYLFNYLPTLWFKDKPYKNQLLTQICSTSKLMQSSVWAIIYNLFEKLHFLVYIKSTKFKGTAKGGPGTVEPWQRPDPPKY